MIEKYMDIWDRYRKEPICVTTNGFVKQSGHAVVGRGVAKQAAYRCPGFALELGVAIKKNGNVVQFLPKSGLIAFPVKPIWGVCAKTKANVVPHMQGRYDPGDVVPGWAMVADVEIIQRSLWELGNLCTDYYCKEPFFKGKIYLPRPGCGAGQLSWKEIVRPLCEVYHDWLVVVNYG